MSEEIRNQYEAATTGAAWVDRSDWGRLAMTGKDRIEHLHRLSTMEVREHEAPTGLTTVLTNSKGRIVDLLTVLYRPDDLLVLSSAGHGTSVLEWLDKFIIREDVELEDLSDKLFHLAMLGPQAVARAKEVLGTDLSATPTWHHASAASDTSAAGTAGLIAYKGESYLGHPSVHLLGPAGEHDDVKAKLQNLNTAPLGADAYEALRIEAGIAGYPAELSEERNPWEARLDASISLDKGCYIGQEVVARLDTYKKVHRTLARFEIDGEVSLPAGEKMDATDGERKVGYLSSTASHPITGRFIGLGYVSGDKAKDGSKVMLGGVEATVYPVVPTGKALGAA